MPDSLIELLRAWQNFYLLTGGASATLIGLLFVALSLGSHLVTTESQQHLDAYVSPVLLYFVSVLMVACLMLIPNSPVLLLVVGLAGMGLWGLIRVARIMIFMLRPDHTVLLYNWFTHVIFPGSSYLLFVLAGLGLLVDNLTLALLAVAFGVIILLVSAIWHSWELVLWVARQPRA
jgi:hypothetical protein